MLPAVALTIAMTSSASAIDFPLTKERARATISAGESTTFSVLALDERYSVDADKETAADLRPAFDVLTPFRTLALQAAEAHAKYATISAKLVRDATASHSLDVSVHLFSPVLGMNTDESGSSSRAGSCCTPRTGLTSQKIR